MSMNEDIEYHDVQSVATSDHNHTHGSIRGEHVGVPQGHAVEHLEEGFTVGGRASLRVHVCPYLRP